MENTIPPQRPIGNISSDVSHPDHYNWHPGGIECIDVIEHFPSNVAQAMKYLWRAGRKDGENNDFDKAIWYIQREKKRLALEKS